MLRDKIIAAIKKGNYKNFPKLEVKLFFPLNIITDFSTPSMVFY